MQRRICVLLIILAVLVSFCRKKSNPVENEDPPNGNGNSEIVYGDTATANVKMPQVDIPWPSLADSPWPMAAHDPQGIARSSLSGPRTGILAWETDLGSGGRIGPAIGADGTIYVSQYEGFFALNSSGEIKWQYDSPAIYTGAVVAADSTIYVAGGVLYAFRPDGSLKWKFAGLDRFAEWRPLIGIDGTILIKDFSGNIYAVNPDSTQKWCYPIGQYGGLTYMSASPDGTVIYAFGSDNSMQAIDAETGSVVWSYPNFVKTKAGPAVDCEGNIYFPGGDEDAYYLYSLFPDGTLRWKYQIGIIGGSITTLPLSGANIDWNGYVYIGWNNRGVYLFDNAGNLRWKLRPGSNDYTMVPIILTEDKVLYIFGNRSPAKVWCYSTNGEKQYHLQIHNDFYYEAGAINTNGECVFSSGSNYLYAIE